MGISLESRLEGFTAQDLRTADAVQTNKVTLSDRLAWDDIEQAQEEFYVEEYEQERLWHEFSLQACETDKGRDGWEAHAPKSLGEQFQKLVNKTEELPNAKPASVASFKLGLHSAAALKDSSIKPATASSRWLERRFKLNTSYVFI